MFASTHAVFPPFLAGACVSERAHSLSPRNESTRAGAERAQPTPMDKMAAPRGRCSNHLLCMFAVIGYLQCVKPRLGFFPASVLYRVEPVHVNMLNTYHKTVHTSKRHGCRLSVTTLLFEKLREPTLPPFKCLPLLNVEGPMRQLGDRNGICKLESQNSRGSSLLF